MSLDTSWQEEAACRGRDINLFIRNSNFRTAKAICATCPVRSQCAGWCDEVERFETNPAALAAVYAGETPAERARRRSEARATEDAA